MTLRFDSGIAAVAPTVDLWITPPTYTAMAPIYFGGGAAMQPVAVPRGSAVLAQIHAAGADGDIPQIALGDHGTAFSVLDDRDFKATATVTESGPLTVTLGGQTLAHLDIQAIADRPPTVALRRPVSVTQHAALRVDYQADDDYGVAGLRLDVWRVAANVAGGALPGGPLSIDVAGTGAAGPTDRRYDVPGFDREPMGRLAGRDAIGRDRRGWPAWL